MTIHVPPQLPNNPHPKIAFVGEAPSDEELDQLKPLVGPSGKIFNAMLRTAGLDRNEYLITNVFDEKLPDNNVANWSIPADEARKEGLTDLHPIGEAGFLKAEHRWHLQRLKDEITNFNPNVIVPLGGTALWAFTGSASIGAARGNVTVASKIVPGVKLVPTYHPAFVIKTWKYYIVVAGDFMKASAEADRGPNLILPTRRLFIEPTLSDLANWLPRLLRAPLLSVDIETGWGQITNIGFSPNIEDALNVPFIDLRKPSKSYWGSVDAEAKAWDFVREVCESDVPKLGQNGGAYDFYWLYLKQHIGLRNYNHDTRLLHHALQPELPKSLSFMGASYTSQGNWKSWGHKGDKRDD